MANKTLCIAGKNDIAVDILAHILKQYPKIEVVACCNSTDNGINTFQKSFKAFCQINNVKILNLNEVYHINDLIFLSLEFDKIIKPSKFKSQSLYNIHFSLLPAYKGMYTSALPLLNGERYSGVTLHQIDKGIDTGNIIDQTKFKLSKDISADQLYNKYIMYGTELIQKNLSSILDGQITSVPQTSTNSSYYSKYSLDYSSITIDLNNTAEQIKNQIRAFSFPYYQLPKVFDIEVYKADILYFRSLEKPGSILRDDYYFTDISTVDYDLRLYKDRRFDLFKSAERGDLSFLKDMVLNHYDVYQKSKEGWDIAIISAYFGQWEYFNYLINDAKWPVNITNNNGTTLLMYIMTNVSKTGDLRPLVAFLKSKKPNLLEKDFLGKDVLYYAQEYGNLEVIEILNSRIND